MAKLIRSVSVHVSNPDRTLDCEFCLTTLHEVAERALAVGWCDSDVEAALLSFVWHRMPDRFQREHTGRLIEKAMRP